MAGAWLTGLNDVLGDGPAHVAAAPPLVGPQFGAIGAIGSGAPRSGGQQQQQPSQASAPSHSLWSF